MEELSPIAALAQGLITNSPKSLKDEELLEYYRVINTIDRASWVARCSVSAEIYLRIKAMVSNKSGKTGAEKETALGNEITKVCKALAIGYQVFMYDVRIHNMFFNPDMDAISAVKAAEMIDAAAIFHRSIFAEASTSSRPREVIDTMVVEYTRGEPVTCEKVRQYIKDTEKKGEKKPEGKIIATIREGVLPPAIEAHIIEVLNGAAKVLEGEALVVTSSVTITSTPEGIKINGNRT